MVGKVVGGWSPVGAPHKLVVAGDVGHGHGLITAGAGTPRPMRRHQVLQSSHLWWPMERTPQLSHSYTVVALARIHRSGSTDRRVGTQLIPNG